ncbi:MAG: hypothetical protein JWO82_2233 [Akkermansiaceae bacterium]|nr:hypothetical protein [Akkermansiaceae bacterium]
MNPKLQRVLSSLVFLLWAGVLIYFYASGRIMKYLAPDFRPYVLAGGLGLAVMGLFTLLTANQQADCGHDHGPGESSHDHEGMDVHPLVAFLILLVPVGLCVSWTQDGFFSSASLARKGAYATPSNSSVSFLDAELPPLSKEIIERQHQKTGDGFHEFSLTELFFISSDPEVRALVEGMPVETEGRMVIDRDGPANQRRLYRLYITCCAADSQAIPIIVRFPDNVPDVKENAWMKISGTMRYPDEGAGTIPVLEASSAVEGVAPAEESFMRGRKKF